VRARSVVHSDLARSGVSVATRQLGWPPGNRGQVAVGEACHDTVSGLRFSQLKGSGFHCNGATLETAQGYVHFADARELQGLNVLLVHRLSSLVNERLTVLLVHRLSSIQILTVQ
jgi:hypothetical protein